MFYNQNVLYAKEIWKIQSISCCTVERLLVIKEDYCRVREWMVEWRKRVMKAKKVLCTVDLRQGEGFSGGKSIHSCYGKCALKWCEEIANVASQAPHIFGTTASPPLPTHPSPLPPSPTPPKLVLSRFVQIIQIIIIFIICT